MPRDSVGLELSLGIFAFGHLLLPCWRSKSPKQGSFPPTYKQRLPIPKHCYLHGFRGPVRCERISLCFGLEDYGSNGFLPMVSSWIRGVGSVATGAIISPIKQIPHKTDTQGERGSLCCLSCMCNLGYPHKQIV